MLTGDILRTIKGEVEKWFNHSQDTEVTLNRVYVLACNSPGGEPYTTIIKNCLEGTPRNLERIYTLV